MCSRTYWRPLSNHFRRPKKSRNDAFLLVNHFPKLISKWKLFAKKSFPNGNHFAQKACHWKDHFHFLCTGKMKVQEIISVTEQTSHQKDFASSSKLLLFTRLRWIYILKEKDFCKTKMSCFHEFHQMWCFHQHSWEQSIWLVVELPICV